MMATVLTRLMPATPSRFIGRSTARTTESPASDTALEKSEMDAESLQDVGQEEDIATTEETEDNHDTYEDVNEHPARDHTSTRSSSDDNDDEDGDDNDDDRVEDGNASGSGQERGNLKSRRIRKTNKRHKSVDVDDDEEEEDSGGEELGVPSSDASSSEEPDWQAEEGDGEQDEGEVVEGSRCTFCNQLEDEDPSEDFELILTCISCGENAHRQCAREANALPSDEDAEDWKCPKCVSIEDDSELREAEQANSRSSAPKIARDLLPAQRAVKAGSHSVFNTLILDDDPMDGSRSLRKRKISNELDTVLGPKKKHRRGSSEVIIEEDVVDAPPAKDQHPARAATPTKPAPASTSEVTPRARSGRLRQQRRPDKPLASVVENNDHRLILSINLKPQLLSRLLEDLKKKKRRARTQARHDRQVRAQAEIPFFEVSHYPAIQSASFTAPFYDSHGREGEETKSKPYGGILSEGEADNTKTFPQPVDRKKFETARLKAEDEWRQKVQAAAAEQARSSQKVVSGPPTRIKCINFGRYEIDTWHSAPYPEEYSRNRVLYICEFCLKYMNSDFVAWRHRLKCPARHPPGDEIYHDGQFSFFEVDGRKNPVYCQNLCLLAKLFLGSKTLYYDVEPFLFYVMTENNDEGCHFVGYFSKEKRPSSQNNVSCILVLPIHQRRGFGHMLIEFSYLLTRVEGKTGSPEKPLSDMGLVSYRNYWRRVLCSYLINQKGFLSINDISDETGMTADDIVSGLEALRVLVRDPVTKAYGLRLDYAYFKQYVENYERKGYAKINPDALTWVPYVMGRDNSHYENAPHIQTVAQRGDDSAMPLSTMPEEGVQLAVNGASEQEYSGSKSGGSIADIPTPLDETERQLHDESSTPFPSFESNTSRQNSPPRSTQAAQNPSTPTGDGYVLDSPIPPSRFEVFPPLPGSSARKNRGRGRPRISDRRGTPLRRQSPSIESPETVVRPSTMRRTRSKLADMTNGRDVESDLPSIYAEDGASLTSGVDKGTELERPHEGINGEDAEEAV